MVYTDHKPLTFALGKIGTANETPRRAGQQLFLSEFVREIRHVNGTENVVADALSRVVTISCLTIIDNVELARGQETEAHITNLHCGKARFAIMILSNTNTTICCEISTGTPRPYVPTQFRTVFDSLHNVSHPGIRTSRKMITQRFFWPKMNKDVGTYVGPIMRSVPAEEDISPRSF